MQLCAVLHQGRQYYYAAISDRATTCPGGFWARGPKDMSARRGRRTKGPKEHGQLLKVDLGKWILSLGGFERFKGVLR